MKNQTSAVGCYRGEAKWERQMCSLSCRGWKETAGKCHLETSLITSHWSLGSQELFWWNFISWAQCMQSRELAKRAGDAGEGTWVGSREKEAAEGVSYMSSDQMRRQDRSQVDSICFPLWKLISWLGEKKGSVEVLEDWAVSEKQMLLKEWLWAWQSLIWALRSTYSTSPSKLISFPGDYSELKGLDPVV